MSNASGFVYAAMEVLRNAGRPLNARKILVKAEAAGWQAPEALSLDALKARLRVAVAGRLLTETRPGVFALASGEPLTIEAPPIELEALESMDSELSLDETIGDLDPESDAEMSLEDEADLEAMLDEERSHRRGRRRAADDRRKRRRRGAQDLAGDAPVAPMAIEEIAAAMANGVPLATDVWQRLSDRAERLLGGAEAPESKSPAGPVVQEAPEAPKAAAAPVLVEDEDASVEVPEDEPAEEVGSAEETGPAEPAALADDVIITSIIQALREAGVPIDGEEILEDIGLHAPEISRRLWDLVEGENHRRALTGQRPPFVRYPDDRLALSEWSVSERYRELERQIQVALGEQRELVRRDLINRLSQLDHLGFTEVIRALIVAMGHDAVSIIHQDGSGNVLFRAEGADQTIAVMACSAMAPIAEATLEAFASHLDALGADEGWVISLGELAEVGEHIADALRLIDRDTLARALYTHGVGLTIYTPHIGFTDAPYFSALS
ncbi:MAG: restriction endonuclease [Bradymonadia bacterium]